MNAFRKVSRSVCLVTLVAFLGLGMQLPAYAAIVGTDASVDAGTSSHAHKLLARQDLREQLVKMGVNPDDAMDRVNNMSQMELAALDGKLKELPAGGDAVGTLALVFLVLLFTDIMGWTNIFPFVKAQR